MWDVKSEIETRKQEFFKLCFGKAAGTMQKLWSEWEKYSYTFIREGELARWIDYVSEAERTESSEAVKKRFYQVKSYLHWLALYRDYQRDKNEPNLARLLNYGYRMLDDGAVSGFPAFYELGNRSGIPGMAFDDKAKWKVNKTPVSAAELDQWIRTDRSRLKIAEPVKAFVPAKSFVNVPNLDRYNKMIADSSVNDNAYWFTNEWVIQIKNKGAGNYIDFTGDYIADPTVTRPIKISVFPFTDDGNVAAQTPILFYEYRATKVKERISLAQLNPGLYTVLIEDPVKIFRLSFSAPVNYSMVMRPSRHIKTTAVNYAFIYVPAGVTRFNIIKSSVVEFITPTGRKVSFTNNKPEDLKVDVLNGEAGLWRVKPLYADLYIEGIPPYLGISAKQMLIPAGSN
jgi:hypothetical protein